MSTTQYFSIANSHFEYHSGWLNSELCQEYFKDIHQNIHWSQDSIRIFGKSHPIPRLNAWMSNDAIPYQYSNIQLQSQAIPRSIKAIQDELNHQFACKFNSVLLNLYRNGADSMGWHCDDEVLFEANASIASISLGASRDFVIRNRQNPKEQIKIPLHNGDLFIMHAPAQQETQHSLPKRATVIEARINLTFRSIRSNYRKS